MELVPPDGGQPVLITEDLADLYRSVNGKGSKLFDEIESCREILSLPVDPILVERRLLTFHEDGESRRCIASYSSGNRCGANTGRFHLCPRHLREFIETFAGEEVWDGVLGREVRSARAELSELRREIAFLKSEVAAARKRLRRVQRKIGERLAVTVRQRDQVVERDRATCQYCWRSGGRALDPDGWTWHIDHRIPHSRRGPHRISNWALACRRCNFLKRDRTDVEFFELLALGLSNLMTGVCA